MLKKKKKEIPHLILIGHLWQVNWLSQINFLKSKNTKTKEEIKPTCVGVI